MYRHLKMDSLYYKFYKGYGPEHYKETEQTTLQSWHLLREQQEEKSLFIDLNPVQVYYVRASLNCETAKTENKEYEIYIDYSKPRNLLETDRDDWGSLIGNIYWRYFNDLSHHPEILIRIWQYKIQNDNSIGKIVYNSWGDNTEQSIVAFTLLKQLDIEIGEYEMEAYSLDESDIYLHMTDIVVNIPEEEIIRKREQEKYWSEKYHDILEKWREKKA